MKYPKAIRKIVNVTAYTFVMLIIAVSVLEFVYRSQLIDTYQPELKSFNSPEVLTSTHNKKKTILVIGDSFSVGGSYPAMLREMQPTYRVINSAVSGTGALEAAIIAPRRFDRFDPDIFIYQIYVGNDLSNISYPINWEKLSAFRNLYWVVSDYLRSVAYLNYRFRQVAESLGAGENLGPDLTRGIDTTETFSVARYNQRNKLYLSADPYFFNDQILLRGSRKADFDVLVRQLKSMLSLCRAPKCRAAVLVIPHVSQTSLENLQEIEALGARFTDRQMILAADYPFVKALSESLASVDNVRILNPIKILQEKENQGLAMYHQNDPHMNTEGQRVIADFVARELQL